MDTPGSVDLTQTCIDFRDAEVEVSALDAVTTLPEDTVTIAEKASLETIRSL